MGLVSETLQPLFIFVCARLDVLESIDPISTGAEPLKLKLPVLVCSPGADRVREPRQLTLGRDYYSYSCLAFFVSSVDRSSDFRARGKHQVEGPAARWVETLLQHVISARNGRF